MSDYFVKIKDQYNNTVLFINDFYKLELFRNQHGVGSLYIDIPLKKYFDTDFRVDWRIEVYRKTGQTDRHLVGETQYLIKNIRYKVDEQNETLLHILAYDPIHLLTKRIIAYPAGTPYALKEDMPADDMIKAIVRENMGTEAEDWRRDLSEWLEIEADKSLAPNVTMDDMSFVQVLPQLVNICDKSKAQGTYLTFDIIYDDIKGKLVFKTYTHQRGIDMGERSQQPLYFSHHTDFVNVRGNGLNYTTVELDATDEVNYVYSGRTSQDVNGLFGEFANEETIKASPFGRSEDFISTGESLLPNDVSAEGVDWLQHKHRNMLFNAHLQEQAGRRFGVDYNFGDIVAVRYLGQTLDIHLDGFTIIVESDGKSEISVISSDMTKELQIATVADKDPEPVIQNIRAEDEDNYGVPLFYKHHSVAQSFKHSSDFNIQYIDIMMRRLRLPQKDVTLSIQTDNADKPSGTELTSVVKPFVYFPDGLYTWIRFKFDAPISVTADSTYWIVLTCGTPKTEYDNYYRVGIETEQRYAGGKFKVSKDGVAWSEAFTGAAEDDDEHREEVSGKGDMIFGIGGI